MKSCYSRRATKVHTIEKSAKLFIILIIPLILLAAQAQAASVFTDRQDYPPGDTAMITGIDFWAGEMVTVRVTHVDGDTPETEDYAPWDAGVNGYGIFDTYWYVPEDALGETLLVTAEGQSSGLIATTTFTDNSTLLVFSTIIADTLCPASYYTVCATLYEHCPGGSYAPLANREILFFINSGNCGVNVGQSANDTVLTDANGNACSDLFLPNGTGTYAIRVKFLGEPNPGPSDSANSACTPGEKVNLSASNRCQVVVFDSVACNEPPSAACPGDTTIELCELTEVCLTGFVCSDPDGNLELCDVSPGSLSGDQVCFTPTAAGSYTLTLVATDSAGLADTCQTVVTITLDTIPPVAQCPGNISVASDVGQCGAVVNFSATVTDNCAGATIACTPASGSLFPVGMTTVTCIATDASGNADTCSFNVTVNDTESPVASCPADITVASDVGACGAVVNFTATVTDNCPGATIACTPASGSLFPVGTTAITCIGTDASGNADTCSFNVTVNETEPPVAQCPGDITVASDVGQCGAVVNFSATVTDNCAGATIACTPASGSLFPVGTTAVTCIATDASGNADTCTFNVTVNETEHPVAQCPGDITVASDVGQCGAVVNFTATVTDNCPGATIACTPASGSLFPIGTTAVTCIATDASGNADTCSFNVTVNDTEPPVASCPADITVNNEVGVCGAVVNFTATVSDNCPGAIIACTPASGSLFPIGTTPVTCIATDASGNADTCSFNVTVNDTESPVASCPADITVGNDAGQCGAVVNFTATATDNCPGVAIQCTPASGSYFAVGTTPVTCIATDASGNADTCSFNVTVNDTEFPVASCPADITVGNDAGQCGAVVNFTATATDNCPGVAIQCTPASGSYFAVGTTSVTCIATDASGNADTCSFNVTVNDTEPPVISCPPDRNIECGGSTHPDSTGYATATDNCDPDPNITWSDSTGGNVIFRTWVATDMYNNSSQCVQKITIIENNPPIAHCPSQITDTTFIPVCSLGTLCIPGFYCEDTDGNLDSCYTNVGTLVDDTLCFTPVEGLNTIILTAVDGCGYMAACTTLVNVVLNNPPATSCLAGRDTLVCSLDSICISGFIYTDPDDNLETVSVNVGELHGDTVCLAPVDGENEIIVTAVDECGASQSCTTLVNVILNRPPTVSSPDDTVYITPDFPVQICLPGFFCDDPDGNLVSCTVSGGDLSGDTVCFTAYEEGTYALILTATDSCGVSKAIASTASCTTLVFVLSPCPVVKIEKTDSTFQGHFESVSITIENASYEMGGFDFLIYYDASALTAVGVTKGQLLEDCDWEYFTHRFGVTGNCGDACPSGLLRIIALANMNYGAGGASCYRSPDADPHELARIRFLVTSDLNFECQYVPIGFFWDDCGDNSISTIEGDSLFIVSRIYHFSGLLLWDEDDDDEFPEDARIPFVGAPDYCLNTVPGKPSAIRCIDFINGGVDIICTKDIDAPGDINLNGVSYEVADAVVFTNYFIYGMGAFTVNDEGQKAATDVNRDGVVLTVADLVYLIRVITGDVLAYYKAAPDMTAEFVAADNGMVIVDAELGAAYFIFKGEVDVSLGADAGHMELLTRCDGENTRALIYSLEKGRTFSGRILNAKGDLIAVEAADYDGYAYKTGLVPQTFSLTCYPNPFNPVTTIEMTLPVRSDWCLTIYNVTGQKLAEFDGRNEAGLVRVNWDATDYASGIYFYKAVAGKHSLTKKLVLLK